MASSSYSGKEGKRRGRKSGTWEVLNQNAWCSCLMGIALWELTTCNDVLSLDLYIIALPCWPLRRCSWFTLQKLWCLGKKIPSNDREPFSSYYSFRRRPFCGPCNDDPPPGLLVYDLFSVETAALLHWAVLSGTLLPPKPPGVSHHTRRPLSPGMQPSLEPVTCHFLASI